ncbi:hypothetical protein CDAR_233711 [Caerostris darwini]|uniref:Uncharacterized protein n=1 Tax=Caerostris darwini TaxID=1538125 RepID=A0AAV4PT15_9ARAC|nr:hypothetical protein CDAR_233711 [Caerostris darwini]
MHEPIRFCNSIFLHSVFDERILNDEWNLYPDHNVGNFRVGDREQPPVEWGQSGSNAGQKRGKRALSCGPNPNFAYRKMWTVPASLSMASGVGFFGSKFRLR